MQEMKEAEVRGDLFDQILCEESYWGGQRDLTITGRFSVIHAEKYFIGEQL